MHAEFYRKGAAHQVLGRARWTAGSVHLEPADDAASAEALRRIFRPTPVVVDDPSMRPAGSAGPVLLPPGSLRWFTLAARSRGAQEDMGVRFVPEGWGAMGFDPAGTYRPFGDQMDRKERLGVARSSAPSQPGERRPEGEEGPSQPGTEAGRPSPAPSSAGPGPADR